MRGAPWFVAGLLLLLLPACGAGGSSGAAESQKRFLLLAHQPLAGNLQSMPDSKLLDLGHQACTGLDASTSPDVIVTQMAGDAEPGSATFDDYSFILEDAAAELCPAHKTEVSSTTPS